MSSFVVVVVVVVVVAAVVVRFYMNAVVRCRKPILNYIIL